jgi:hypothetical protein
MTKLQLMAACMALLSLPAHAITFKNTGDHTLHIIYVGVKTVPGSFNLPTKGTCIGAALAPGATCNMPVAYKARDEDGGLNTVVIGTAEGDMFNLPMTAQTADTAAK